jgi:hypothetical protein
MEFPNCSFIPHDMKLIFTNLEFVILKCLKSLGHIAKVFLTAKNPESDDIPILNTRICNPGKNFYFGKTEMVGTHKHLLPWHVNICKRKKQSKYPLLD